MSILRITLVCTLLSLGACSNEGEDASKDTDSTDSETSDTVTSDTVVAEVTNITPEELLSMLDNKDFELINVHIPDAGEIVGTDVHISFQDVDAIETYLDNDKSKRVVVYCLTGPMSKTASEELVARGYYNVFDMPAGMATWKQLGYPWTE